MQKALVPLVAVIALGFMGFVGYLFLNDSGKTKEQRPFAPLNAGNPATERGRPVSNTPGVGQPAPDIVGVDLDGKPLKLSDYRGKVVVVDFWGYWCPHCVAMIPHEKTMVKKLEGKPFALLGVNNDRSLAEAQEGVKRDKITWPSFFDDQAKGTPICSAWGIQSFPAIFVIDHKGVIRYTNVRGAAMEAAVETLLKEMEKGVQQ